MGTAQEIRWGVWIRDLDKMLADYDAKDSLTERQQGERNMLVTLLSEVKAIRATPEFDVQPIGSSVGPAGMK